MWETRLLSENDICGNKNKILRQVKSREKFYVELGRRGARGVRKACKGANWWAMLLWFVESLLNESYNPYKAWQRRAHKGNNGSLCLPRWVQIHDGSPFLCATQICFIWFCSVWYALCTSLFNNLIFNPSPRFHPRCTVHLSLIRVFVQDHTAFQPNYTYHSLNLMQYLQFALFLPYCDLAFCMYVWCGVWNVTYPMHLGSKINWLVDLWM